LTEKKIVKKTFDKIKILGNGEISVKLDVTAHAFSKSAKEKIESVGGTITILPEKKSVVKNKMGSAKKAKIFAKSKKQ
jgi:large subunit ribosomal protein L15